MEILIDTLQDTFLILPILFILYICLEYFEHKQENISYERYLSQYGPILGALLGMIPQCGFGVLASLLFIENKITLGTLISVFVATSDEAIPLLITNPQMYSSLIGIIIFKLLLGIIAGYIVDYLFKKEKNVCFIQNTHHHEHSIFIEAGIRTIKIYTFIFIVNFLLSFLIETIGTEQLSIILMNHSMFQPIASAIIGFIPNCAASVVLTQLYMNQALSFASLLAGLVTNAGLGILVLIQNKLDIKTILKICLILMITALIICLPLQWFYLH